MILGCAFTVTLPMSLYNVLKAYRNNTLKHHSCYESFLPFLSPVILFILCTLWVHFSSSDIIEHQPRMFYFLVGTAFSNITCKLIVCQMSNTRCQPLSWILLPVAVSVAVILTELGKQNETLILYCLTALVAVAHIHYGVCVVSVLLFFFFFFFPMCLFLLRNKSKNVGLLYSFSYNGNISKFKF
ncbi:EPT1 Ethanolaminephosphotransferase, partial [Polypterus senegalus]|nr:EPT1 Ethanolaminephosphotransferase [Polypterus senegalus]